MTRTTGRRRHILRHRFHLRPEYVVAALLAALMAAAIYGILRVLP